MRAQFVGVWVAVLGCAEPADGDLAGIGAPFDDATAQVSSEGTADGAALRAALAVNLGDPLTAGAPTTYTVSGADPGEKVILAASTAGVGPGPCPAVIGGLCLSLNAPLLNLGAVFADAQGVAVFPVVVPGGTPSGAELSVQAIAKRGVGGAQSVKSNPRTDVVGASGLASGLAFPGNGAPESDIRLVWDGADLLPRVGHTVILRYRPAYQDGYYAVAWHSPNDGVWDSGVYSWGTHPYPGGDGSVNASGQALDGSGSTGTEHYWESAGLGVAADYLASPGGTSVAIVEDVWVVQVRKCRQIVGGPDNGKFEHIYVPDLLGNPTFQIRQLTTTVGSGGADPAFYLGGSDWRATFPFGADQNDETVNGVLRGIQLYDTFLSDADAAIEAANISSDTPVTAAGLASVHYLNQNPTPDDVTDRSGAGHDPSWANAFRPALWQE
ncbi:MAG: hypothetical protein ABMB14_21135 [Myxococcota bacterium]